MYIYRIRKLLITDDQYGAILNSEYDKRDWTNDKKIYFLWKEDSFRT